MVGNEVGLSRGIVEDGVIGINGNMKAVIVGGICVERNQEVVTGNQE